MTDHSPSINPPSWAPLLLWWHNAIQAGATGPALLASSMARKTAAAVGTAARFRKSDAKGLIEVAMAAGLTIARLVVSDGRLEIITPDGEALAPPGDDLDREQAEWEARHGQG